MEGTPGIPRGGDRGDLPEDLVAVRCGAVRHVHSCGACGRFTIMERFCGGTPHAADPRRAKERNKPPKINENHLCMNPQVIFI